MSGELPRTWAYVPLGDVVKIRNGFAFPSKDFRSSGVPVIRQSNLDGERVSLEKCVYVDPSYLHSHPSFVLERGDLLIGMSGSIGKLCHYDLDVPALQNQRTGKLDILDRNAIKEAYLYNFLKTCPKQLLQKGKGIGVANVSAADIESLLFPLPPFLEQNRIVKKLEDLQIRSKRARVALDSIPPLIEKFRQCVLAAAFRGDLTKEWREKNQDKIEPASELLKRIRIERRMKWEKEQLKKFKAAGKVPKDDKWKEKYKEPEPVDTDGLPELPEGWCWASVEEIGFVTKLAGFEFTKYVTYDPTGEVDVIKAENVGKKGFVETAFSKVSEQTLKQLPRSRLQPNDILMVFVGAGVCQVAAVPPGRIFFLGPNVALIRLTSGVLTHTFLEHYLRSPTGLREALSLAKSTAQPSISMQQIRSIPVPVAPFEEQLVAVDTIESALNKGNAIAGRVLESISTMAHLNQSILAKAFRGELVPQDPNDEPASVLLERIKKDRQPRPFDAKKVKRPAKRLDGGKELSPTSKNSRRGSAQTVKEEQNSVLVIAGES